MGYRTQEERIIPPKKRWNQQEGAGITTLTTRKP